MNDNNSSNNSSIKPTASIPGSNEASNHGILTPSNNDVGRPAFLSPASVSAGSDVSRSAYRPPEAPVPAGNDPCCSGELLQEKRASQHLHLNGNWPFSHDENLQETRASSARVDAAKQQPLAENSMAQQEVNSIPGKRHADKPVPTQAKLLASPSLACKPTSHSDDNPAIAQASGLDKAGLESSEKTTQAQATQLLPPRLDEFAAQIPAGHFKVSEKQADHISLGYGDQADDGAISVGNRWPRQETLALLQIRADMDAAFRNAIVKRPLWDEVSRKLADLGYKRSAKKCKEKFENVNKYYKRIRGGRAGRQDGKVYRFCSQLEAFSSPSASIRPAPAKLLPPSSACFPDQFSLRHLAGDLPSDRCQAEPACTELVSAIASTSLALHSSPRDGIPGPAGQSLSQSSSPDTALDNGVNAAADDENAIDGDDGEEDTGSVPLPSVPFHESAHGLGAADRSKKRRRDSSTFLMAFFEGLLRRVMKKQEEMQQRFLQAMEKRENERMIREEAWRRQEMARLNKEDELSVQERSSSAARDAAVIAFLQKISGQAVDLPAVVAVPASAPILAQPVQSAPPFLHHGNMFDEFEEHEASDLSSKRWLKCEVLHLIELHGSLQARFAEAGSTGPLWEEIGHEMAKRGYPNRTGKRCKQKWEKMNKYFKMAKESSKKRPEFAKACPYFHELNALNRKDSRLSTNASNVLFCNRKNGCTQNENVAPQLSTSDKEGELDSRSCLQTEHIGVRPESVAVTDGSRAYIDRNHNKLGDTIANKSPGDGILQGTGTMQHSLANVFHDSVTPSTSDHIRRRTGFPVNFGSCTQEACSSGI